MANIIYTTGASSTAPATQGDFLALADDAILEARDALDELSSRQYIRSYAPSAGELPNYSVSYQKPSGRPAWSFENNIPDWTNIALNLNPVTHTTVDDFTGEAPGEITPNIPLKPIVTKPSAPGLAPTVDDVTIPDTPEPEDISDPKEWMINIPVTPLINILDFTTQAPDMSGVISPDGNFSWNEIAYDSDTLDNTVALVNTFSEGGVVIPDAIWEALWAKDNDRANRAGEKLIDEINNEWSKRGFQLPQGVQVAQIQEVRQNLQSDASSRSRDLAIKEADLHLDNLKYAVQQGIALENMRGGWYQQALTRTLDATKYTYQLSLDIFNAEVNFYNARLQAYQAEATVYKIQIEAEVTKLELYKTELEGQKIIGDLNLQQVQIYKTKVDALNTTIALYNSTLQSIKIGVEIDATRIDAYSKEVQAYGERIKAVALEYDIYKTEMQGAQIEGEIYNTNVKAFASKVSAYSAKVDAEAKSTGAEVEINKLLLEEYSAKLKAYNSQVEGAIQEIRAETAQFEGSVKSYVLDVDSEKTRTTVLLQELAREIQYAAQRTQASITGAQLDLDAEKSEAALTVEALKQVATTESNLASAALSAVNISQSMNDTALNSYSSTA